MGIMRSSSSLMIPRATCCKLSVVRRVIFSQRKSDAVVGANGNIRGCRRMGFGHVGSSGRAGKRKGGRLGDTSRGVGACLTGRGSSTHRDMLRLARVQLEGMGLPHA